MRRLLGRYNLDCEFCTRFALLLSRDIWANRCAPRSAFDAPIARATTTTSVFHALAKATQAAAISQNRTLTASSSRTRFPSSTANGGPTRSSSCWREPRHTGWVPGQTLQTTLAASGRRTKSATTTSRSLLTRRASPSRKGAAPTTWNSQTKSPGKNSKRGRSVG